MACRGVANVIGAPDDRQTPLAGSGFRPRSVDKKMGLVYNPARLSISTPVETKHGAD
jgi:hypothetical protein